MNIPRIIRKKIISRRCPPHRRALRERAIKNAGSQPLFYASRQSSYKRLNTKLQRFLPARMRGIAAVEMAISSFVFFLLIFTILDFSIYSFVNLTMQHAVREGARYAITGQAGLDPLGGGDREQAIIQKIRDSSAGFFDDLLTVSDIDVTDSNGVPVAGFGAPGQTIVITLNCQWPQLSPFIQAASPGSNYNFSVGASLTNEAFPGANP